MNERGLHVYLEVRPIAFVISQRVRLVEASRIGDQGVPISGLNSGVIRFPPFKIIAME